MILKQKFPIQMIIYYLEGQNYTLYMNNGVPLCVLIYFSYSWNQGLSLWGFCLQL